MEVDPRLWRTFVVLSEERHFGRTARRVSFPVELLHGAVRGPAALAFATLATQGA